MCSSTNTVLTKSRTARWVGIVAGKGEKRHANRYFRGKPVAKNGLEDMSLNGVIILKWVVRQ